MDILVGDNIHKTNTYKTITSRSKASTGEMITKKLITVNIAMLICAALLYFLSPAFVQLVCEILDESYNSNTGRLPFWSIIIFYAIMYLIARNKVLNNENMSRQCFITVDEAGVRGKFLCYSPGKALGSVNGMAYQGLKDSSFTYRQINNSDLDNGCIVISVDGNKYSCPNLQNAHEVYEIIKNNLSIYDRR